MKTPVQNPVLSVFKKFNGSTELFDEVSRNLRGLEKGVLKERKISDDGIDYHIPAKNEKFVAFSWVQDQRQILVAYNASEVDTVEEWIMVDDYINKNNQQMKTVYGYIPNSCAQVYHSHKNGTSNSYVKLYFKPKQLVILQNM